MKYRRVKGSNQYQAKFVADLTRKSYKAPTLLVLGAVAVMGICNLPQLQKEARATDRILDPMIISPLPLAGKSAEMAKPKITPVPTLGKDELTPREKLIVRTLQEFGPEHLEAMHELIKHESGFRPTASNPSSKACGMFQAWPCEKMKCAEGDADCQINWGINYIKERYGNPTEAWAFWQARVPINGQDVGNWY